MDNYCKICFKKIEDISLYNFINKRNLLCENCFNKLRAKFIKFKINNINGLAIYEYDENIKELIYKFKGCYDYELKDVFLFRYLNYFKIKYKGWHIVFIPSYYLDDEKRGFNHVKAIFECLKLNELPILKKKISHKQSSQSSKDRRKISDVLEIDEKYNLKDKKILVVDDIITTGSTLFTAIELIKKYSPKKIEVLVVAKTIMRSKSKY